MTQTQRHADYRALESPQSGMSLVKGAHPHVLAAPPVSIVAQHRVPDH